jgi:hypothetical protein
MMAQKPRLLDQVRQKLRIKNYAYRTEQSYVHWIRRYILYHEKRHPADMGKTEAEDFLGYLAIRRPFPSFMGYKFFLDQDVSPNRD